MAMDIALEVATRDGQPVVRKVAETHAAADRLRRERTRLEASRHPGVVRLIGAAEDPVTLTLGWAGSRSLETARPDLATAVELLAVMATTVADLHDRGIVHGRLDPSHVVIDGRGRPTLCGMAGPDPGDPPPTVEDDVAGLGTLIGLLVGADAEAEPIPEHRWRRRRWDGYVRGALLTLADQTAHPDPEHRPTARRLARAIGDLVPVDHGDAGDDVDGGVRRLALAASAAVTALVLVVGIATRLDHRHGPSSAASVLAPPDAVAATSVTDTAPSTTRVAPSTTSGSSAPPTAPDRSGSGRCRAISGPKADLDDDGCADPIVIDGAGIRSGPTIFQLGRRGDRLAVGDWDCDGVATPALVRPSTGDVYLFSRWAAAGKPVTLSPTARVAGARGPASTAPTRCGPLRVRRSDGTTATVPQKEPR